MYYICLLATSSKTRDGEWTGHELIHQFGCSTSGSAGPTVNPDFLWAWIDHQFGSRLMRPDGQGNIQINGVWKEAWKLKVPGKVKHFTWKVLRGVLPCLGVLATRHIPVVPQCPRCTIGEENIQHTLFGCRGVREVWAHLGLLDTVQKAISEDRSGSITMEILLKNTSIIEGLPVAELISVAAWFLWWQRRQIMKGIGIQNPEKTALSIRVLATNYFRSSLTNSLRDLLGRRDYFFYEKALWCAYWALSNLTPFNTSSKIHLGGEPSQLKALQNQK